MKRLQLPRHWAEIHWPDLAGIDLSGCVAVLPLAATEQHGPHLPLGTDSLIAKTYIAEVQKLLPNDLPATFLPVQDIGISTEHVDFPGTLTLPPEAALAHWLAIGDSVARAGLRRLVIVTSHGGNSAAMTMVAQELRARFAMLVVTTSWGRLSAVESHLPAEEVLHGIHGGAAETAIMLARHPELVRRDRIADFCPSSVALAAQFKLLSTQRPAPLAWMAQDLHGSGAIGNATLATPEIGEALIGAGARTFCELLAETARFDLGSLNNTILP
jgi:creatinine amidohydrolase